MYFEIATKNVVVALDEVFLLKDEIKTALQELMDRGVKWARSVPRSAAVLKSLGDFLLSEVRYVFTLVQGHERDEIVAALNDIDVAHVQNEHVTVSMYERFHTHGLLSKTVTPRQATLTSSPTTPSTTPSFPPVTPVLSSRALKNHKYKERRARRVAELPSSNAGTLASTTNPVTTPSSTNASARVFVPYCDRPCPFFWSTKGCDAARKQSKIACTPAAHRAVTGPDKAALLAAMTKIGLIPSQDF